MGSLQSLVLLLVQFCDQLRYLRLVILNNLLLL